MLEPQPGILVFVLRPATSASPGSCEKCRISGPTLELLNQPEFLTRSPCDVLYMRSFRSTVLDHGSQLGTFCSPTFSFIHSGQYLKIFLVVITGKMLLAPKSVEARNAAKHCTVHVLCAPPPDKGPGDPMSAVLILRNPGPDDCNEAGR